jgi:hypothetical protein
MTHTELTLVYRFARGYFDYGAKLQDGITHIMGFNEPGKTSLLTGGRDPADER